MAVHPPSPSVPSGCLHCGLPVDRAAQADFCCIGCKSVYGLLHREHLDRYYALRGVRGVPVAEARAERRDSKWLEVVQARLRASEGRHGRLILDVQGLHCVGCVWLIEELFARAGGSGRIVVNPALGRVDLLVERSFDLAGFVSTVERHGYLFGPAIKRAPAASGDLLWRLGVCAAIAMNSMIFGIAIYAGLDRGPIFDLFTTLNFGLGAAAVMVAMGTLQLVHVRDLWTETSRGATGRVLLRSPAPVSRAERPHTRPKTSARSRAGTRRVAGPRSVCTSTAMRAPPRRSGWRSAGGTFPARAQSNAARTRPAFTHAPRL